LIRQRAEELAYPLAGASIPPKDHRQARFAARRQAPVGRSGYIGRADFWKFGLIFGIVFLAGQLLIVLPWLRAIG